MLFQKQLTGMAEGDPVRAHHPVDHRPAGIAPEAVPEVALRRHDAARGLIALVPGTAAGQVLTLRDQPMSLALDEAHERDLAFQTLELGVRDARHATPVSPRPVDERAVLRGDQARSPRAPVAQGAPAPAPPCRSQSPPARATVPPSARTALAAGLAVAKEPSSECQSAGSPP